VDLRDRAARERDQLVVGEREDRVRRASRGPDLVEGREILIDDGRERGGVPRGGDTADRLTGGRAHLLDTGSDDAPPAETLREGRGVDAVGAAGHDEERFVIRPEDETVRDGTDLNAEGGC